MRKRCEILSVGTELLLGDIVNTNAQYIARGLSNLGIDVFFQTVVGDNETRFIQAIELAKSRADILITTGGLGPTADDLTKEVIARNFGKQLVLHQPTLDALYAFFQRSGREMTENNKKQAMLPEGCIVLENPNGTAPGCIMEGDDGKIAILMPGPPREMKPLFDGQVRDYLKQFSDGMILSHSLHMIGIGESTMESRVRDLIDSSENPTLAPYAKDGECLLRITAKAADEAAAEALMAPLMKEIQSRLGEYIYGIDGGLIEEHLIKLLQQRGRTVAFAESCTGGLLSKRMTDIPGASAVFGTGVVAYANETKQQLLGVSEATLLVEGAVSSRCAIEMARGIYALSGADYGLGVTGIAGPGGGTPEKPVGLCYLALYDGTKTWVKKLNYQRSRDYIRITVANNAFDMVRRAVLHEQQKEA